MELRGEVRIVLCSGNDLRFQRPTRGDTIHGQHTVWSCRPPAGLAAGEARRRQCRAGTRRRICAALCVSKDTCRQRQPSPSLSCFSIDFSAPCFASAAFRAPPRSRACLARHRATITPSISFGRGGMRFVADHRRPNNARIRCSHLRRAPTKSDHPPLPSTWPLVQTRKVPKHAA